MTDAGSPNVTIVTAFFDVGRGAWSSHQRPREEYFGWFGNLISLANPVVVFTSPDLEEAIVGLAAGNQRVTVLVGDGILDEQQDLRTALMHTIEHPGFRKFSRNVVQVNPTIDAKSKADYLVVNLQKARFVDAAIDAGLVHTDWAAWVDFGYLRTEDRIPKQRAWNVDLATERIHHFSLRQLDDSRPVFDIARNADRYVIGGMIVARRPFWERLATLRIEMMWSLLDCGLLDDDQTVAIMCVREKPELFEIHPIADWFDALVDYDATPAAAEGWRSAFARGLGDAGHGSGT